MKSFFKKNRRVFSATTILIGIALITAGVFRGEEKVVLKKATKICLECIGIG